MRAVDIEPFSLALSRPLGTAKGDVTEREGFLVRVEHEGETGIGEATPLPGWTESLADCHAVLERVAEDGVDPRAALTTTHGTPAARHALESAVVDAEARLDGEPLAAWLTNGPVASEVPANATVGDGSPEETVEEARAAVERGFPALKVKVGARAPAADRERLEAVRAACPDIELRADANGAWDPETAASALDWLADLDAAYVEQPLAAEDLDGHAALRGRDVGVALDESLTEYGVERVLSANAADVLVLKPMALGGPVATRRAALFARDDGVDAVLTTTIDGAAARATAVHVAASLPGIPACGLATADRLTADLFERDPVPVLDGAIRLQGGPGVC
jgi:o-succinylbenzoate synthase